MNDNPKQKQTSRAVILLVTILVLSCNNYSVTHTQNNDSAGVYGDAPLVDDSIGVVTGLDSSQHSDRSVNRTELLEVAIDSGVIGFYLGWFQERSDDKLTNPALNGYYRPGVGETYIINIDSSQVLRMITQPGDAKGVFSEFELRHKGDGEVVSNMCSTFYETLRTTQGISLGDSLAKIESLLPMDHVRKEIIDSRRIKLNCRIEGMNRFAYLSFHNMPIYFSKLEFRDQILIKYSFGFEYP